MKKLFNQIPVAFLALTTAVFSVPGFDEPKQFTELAAKPIQEEVEEPQLIPLEPEPTHNSQQPGKPLDTEQLKPDPPTKADPVPWPDVSYIGPNSTKPKKPEVLPNFKTAALGNGFAAVISKTNSWEELIRMAFNEAGGDALIDIHFNKYKGQHSGPLILTSRDGAELARALQREFIEIYEEQGWIYDKEFDIRQNVKNIALTSRGNKLNKAILISEFGYVDDPNNPIGKYIQTKEGAKRIARAYKNAGRGLNLNIVLSAGHHGTRGSSGAEYKGFHETTFAFSVINSLFNLQHPKPTGNPPLEYQHYDPKAIPEQLKPPQSLSYRNPAITVDSDGVTEWTPGNETPTGYLTAPPDLTAIEPEKKGLFSKLKQSIKRRPKKACKT